MGEVKVAHRSGDLRMFLGMNEVAVAVAVAVVVAVDVGAGVKCLGLG